MPSLAHIRWAKTRSFITIAAALSILGVLVYLLSNGRLFAPKAALRVYVSDSSALAPGAVVRLNGILVGKLKKVRLSGSSDPSRVVELTLSIDKDVFPQIPEDTLAQISSETLLGDSYVDLTKGKSPRPVAEGGELRFQAPSVFLKNIDMTQLNAKIRKVDAYLRSIEAGEGSLGHFFQNDEMYYNLLHQVAGVQQALADATRVTGDLGQLLYRDALYNQIRAPIQNLDRALAEIQAGHGPAGELLTSSKTYDEVAANLAELRRALAGASQSSFLQSDEAYTQWNKNIAALIRSVDEIDRAPLLAGSQPYETLMGALKELGGNVKEFRENPQKFLRIKLF